MKLWRYGHAIENLSSRYHLEGALGSGGMADVCLAWDEHEQREVAIKVIKPDQLEQKTLDRFVKEAAQVARWQHPNILRIYSDLKLELLDPQKGSIVPYIVMEYAQGGDLHRRLTPGKPYPFATTLDLFAQLCSAVTYAHQHGVIHRDLKPLNILFRQLPGGSEQVVLSDFGLAVEAAASHHTFAHGGTLPYMAPEQLLGRALPASDIFALGVIFYQLCTGRMPFRRSLQELRLREPLATPLRPSAIVQSLPASLDDVVLTALASDPELRYVTADDFWTAIHEAVYNSRSRPSGNSSTQRRDRTRTPGTRATSTATGKYTAPRRAVQPSQEVPSAFVEQIAASLDSQDLPAPIHTVSSRAGSGFAGAIVDQDALLSDPVEISYSHENMLSDVDGQNADPAEDEPSEIPYHTADTSARKRSAVTTTPPGAVPAWQHRKRSGRRIPTLLALLCIGGVLAALLFFALYRPAFSLLSNPRLLGSALVTITPDSKEIGASYMILAVPNGVPNPDQHQIAARTLSSPPATQTKTVNGTGHNQVAATVAHGTLTFTNGASNPFTVAAGTQLQAANGASVVTDGPITIPAANPALGTLGVTAGTAHASAAGANGNIAAGSVSGTCCSAGNFVTVRNNNAFSGGVDPKNYSFVQQGDVDAFVNSVQGQLTQQANSALRGQLKPGEQLAAATNCPATVSKDRPVGDQGVNIASTTVTVSVTCQAQAYDQNGMQSLVSTLLQQKARTDAGAAYSLQGTIITHAQVQQINADHSVSLLVTSRGLWVYQVSNAQKQQLARLIAGKASDTAKTLLLAQIGVHAATISSGSATLPSAPGQITIALQPVPALQA